MKAILHTIDTTGPGGAETVFIDLATHLSKKKYHSIAVIRGRGWVYDELQRRGIEPILLNAKGSFNWRYLKSLVGLIRDERIDLIQSHLLGSNVYCSLAGLITRTPVVATFHGAVDIGVNERLKGIKFGIINVGASCIVAVSDMLRDDIVSRTSLKANKTKIIYNGINTSEFQRPRSETLRQKFRWSKNDVIIGCLGNVRPAKGYDILLRAAALLERAPRSFRFVIAGQGKGKLYEDLLVLRKELDLEDKVHFLGFVDDASDFLSNLDLFLSSSVSEGLPLSAIQAMVSKLPIIATRCGGYEEIVTHQENGWLVEAGNPKAIANAIVALAADPKLQAEMGGKAWKRAIETFEIDVMLNNYEEIYDRLLIN